MLQDFVDNSDEEPDFTHVGLANNRSNEPVAAEPENYVSDCVRLPRKYAPEDLLPVETDPSCKADWFLAAYWPVYVSNFKVEDWEDQSTWYEQVSNYFAYNGLLTRMIYIHHHQETENGFAAYQRKCMLIDMLVYFTSKADADRAIATCHRDSYYGYKLNVLPGRDPVFFHNERSVRFTELSGSVKYSPVEAIMEKVLTRHGPVTFTGRYPYDSIVLEFVSTEAMLAAVASQYCWKPVRLDGEFAKQRFLEDDVKLNIDWTKEQNPTFMDMQPKASVLVQLFEGVRPNVSTSWQGYTTYARAPLFKKRQREKDERAKMMLFNKRNKIEKPRKAETETVTRDPPLAPPPKTKWQIEAEKMQAVNGFLRQYGAAPITKASVEEARMKVQRQMQGH